MAIYKQENILNTHMVQVSKTVTEEFDDRGNVVQRVTTEVFKDNSPKKLVEDKPAGQVFPSPYPSPTIHISRPDTPAPLLWNDDNVTNEPKFY